MQKTRMENWQKVMLLVLGFVVFLIGIGNILSGPSRKHWKVTQGKVVFLSIREYSVTNIWSQRQSFNTEVIFEYEVDGKKYVSDNVPLTDKEFSNRTEAERFLRNFEIGQVIDVYYNPFEPQMALYILEDDRSTLANLGIVMFGSIMLAYGTFLLLVSKT